MNIKTIEGNFDNPKVNELLVNHFKELRSVSPENSCHVLDIEGLKTENIKFWSFWEEDELVGCGALKFLEKKPFYFLRDDKKMMFIAGIFADNEFCLITEQASQNVNEIHHRQPVILNEKDVNNYLNLQIDGSNFLKEANKPNLEFYEISKDVNKPTNKSISLIQKIN